MHDLVVTMDHERLARRWGWRADEKCASCKGQSCAGDEGVSYIGVRCEKSSLVCEEGCIE